jgi:hypothetical protein
MTLTLDRSQYAPGDTMRICYRLIPEGVQYFVRLSQMAPSERLLLEGVDDGAGGADCLNGEIDAEASAGVRRFLVEAFIGGQKVAQATAEATVSVPQSGWQICEHPNFGGRCVSLVPGDETALIDLNRVNFNDMASSIRAGGGTLCLWVYEHTYYGGRELQVRPGQSIPDLAVPGFNDTISSAEFGGCTSSGGGQPSVNWSVTLRADRSTPYHINEQVTLTATANADVATAGYHISFWIPSVRLYVGNSCYSGTTCSTSVGHFTGPQYRARILDSSGRVIAESATVSITWTN